MTRLSFSKLSRFETCPLSYKLHYLDRLTSEPGVPLLFGSAVHAVLEDLVREHMHEERVGALPEDRAAGLWQEAWAKSGMSGIDVFREGLDIVHRFVREQGLLEHHDVLAVEKEFRIDVGGFTVLGYLDRVDRVDDETVEVIDYKTNRQLFTREETDASLQMSLYHLAAQELWPWAKKVRLTFWMLRHGLRQTTERTADDIEGTRRYVETLGTTINKAREFPAKLNSNCVYCDHRKHCPTYADALQGKREFICEDNGDLEAVAKEREEVARLAKVLYARKGELEGVIKTALKEHDQLVLGGVRYTMFKTSKTEYPLDRSLAVLAEATGLARDELLDRIVSIDNKALEALLKELGKSLDRPRLNLLKAELDAIADKTHSPRFWAKEVA
ncbi:MAG: PD-(D/E)XK nuclease family protein [Deltaproteobacteria bacterium]|nr:PD-(D/E)XK nuclease family protein [Deltaproteobacteria bacterium]